MMISAKKQKELLKQIGDLFFMAANTRPPHAIDPDMGNK